MVSTMSMNGKGICREKEGGRGRDFCFVIFTYNQNGPFCLSPPSSSLSSLFLLSFPSRLAHLLPVSKRLVGRWARWDAILCRRGHNTYPISESYALGLPLFESSLPLLSRLTIATAARTAVDRFNFGRNYTIC
jgi:hypothetical protein